MDRTPYVINVMCFLVFEYSSNQGVTQWEFKSRRKFRVETFVYFYSRIDYLPKSPLIVEQDKGHMEIKLF